QGQLLVTANFNCPGQIVISGDVGACDRAAKLAEERGAMKAVKLAVAGAFHSQMMKPAAQALEQAIAKASVKAPSGASVIANINAEYYRDPDSIADGLVRQLVQPVLWQRCMEKLLAEGVESFYEIGTGRVLTGLMRRINRKAKVIEVGSAEALKGL
ncbi:MAG TPA: ACP S-malonyltransferase, partial [Sedimentisphaerales bacterium]|nr:ACP S-malonyltransferase [Sedimentisphaerales bacterium]